MCPGFSGRQYEEEVVRQIEYTASIIAKTYQLKNDKSMMNKVLDLITNEHKLLVIRQKLIVMLRYHKRLKLS